VALPGTVAPVNADASSHADGRPPSARTIWLTGLSGSGKSTVARLVAAELRARGRPVEVLDGDVVRRLLCADLGFTREDRETNVRRIAFVADLLSRNGVTAIAAVISPYRDARDQVRGLLGERFVEVYVRASVEECERRDVKGLYEKARAGEIRAFTGVSDPYEEPLSPELLVDTEQETAAESAARLIALIEERLAGAAPVTAAV
jgi:adenylylsulfate kinase